MKSVRVDLGNRSYSILISSCLLGRFGALMREHGAPGDLFIVTDHHVGPLYAEGGVVKSLIESDFRVETCAVPAGESSKSIETALGLYTRLIGFGLKRDGWIVALGGGVVGDLAGFVASTYLRGVPFVQIPTTILSQVDSSVGGKVGVNHPLGKNVIGSFYQPRSVCIDPDTLKTLPLRERWSGLAEVVKYGLIADEPLFDLLEENIEDLAELRDTDLLENVLFRCCQIKAGIVEKDETENGLRRILNFGHTMGHAVEAQGGFNLFRHGEAITAGMLWAVWVSERKGHLDRPKAARIRALLKTFPLPPGIADIRPAQLWEKVQLDKKQSAGGIHLVLLNGIGRTLVEKSPLETWMIDEGWKDAIS